MARSHICIINMGGSAGMSYNTSKAVLEDGQIMDHLLEYIPELQKRFSIDVVQIHTGYSYNITKAHWLELADFIFKNYDKYSGFVVIHGTSTMAYTASWLSFAMQNLDKPIVFTGSILPLEEVGSEGRFNIINACLVAELDLAEVLIVYGSKILRANRAKKVEEQYTNVFRSPNYPLLGQVKRPITLHSERKKRRKRILKYKPVVKDEVMALQAVPWTTPELLRSLALEQDKVVVLLGYGAGVIPDTLVPVLKEIHEEKRPVVIASQMHQGISAPFTYNFNKALDERKVIFTYDMTIEATVTKLMWIIAQTDQPYMMRKMMYENMAGEISDQLERIPREKRY